MLPDKFNEQECTLFMVIASKSYICSDYIGLHAFLITPGALRGVTGKESSLYSTSLTAVIVEIDNLYLNNM
jgi:hypothetical protein